MEIILFHSTRDVPMPKTRETEHLRRKKFSENESFILCVSFAEYTVLY
jgi:hypothetical protein